ncbi:MAG: hypothetical protein AAF996_12085 [Pseudomonadota bacterium]
MKHLSAILLTAVLASVGCESTPAETDDPRARLAMIKPAIDSVPSSGLGPQELQSSECGLFLWSQTDTSKFIFFSKALTGVAVFAQDEEPIQLTQSRAGGDIFGQFNTRLEYVSNDGRVLTLELVPGELLEGGQRIESGLLSLADREGWLTKLPVLGVRACQRE